jgi:hypothetical protein
MNVPGMVRVDLRGTFGYGPRGAKVLYGPGTDVLVPAGLARALKLKDKGAASAASAVSEPVKDSRTVPASKTADLFDGLSEAQVAALKDAGFNTRRRLQKGMDSGEVQAVSGIGPAAVEKLTQNLGG